MNYNNEQAEVVLKALGQEMAMDTPPHLKLKRMWWTIIGLRARYLANIVRRVCNGEVMSGPFKGMKLTQDAINAYNACLVLGAYEHELHDVFEKIISGNYTRILNIGCSVGYYAVGLARRMPHLTIDAFDTNPEARDKCAAMAALNGVEDRVRISGEFCAANFEAYANESTIAIVDIEGGELSLLDPDAYPALRQIDIVVELHDVLREGMSKMVSERFASSHGIQIIQNKTALPNLDTLLPPNYHMDPFDHLLMGWEGRDGSTPWGVFIKNTVKTGG